MILETYKEAGAVLAKKPIRLWGISLLSGILGVVFALLFGPVIGISLALIMLVSTGMTMVYLHGFRGEQVEAVQLFDCFKDWATIKRVLCGLGWQALWLFLWLLIPIVGFVFAIMKAYAWRFVPYILVQEPEIAPTEALRVSEQRTQGYKAQMFGADWLVFALIFVALLVLGLFAALPVFGGLFALAGTLLMIASMLFTNLFLGLVHAGFYEKITANIAATRNCPNCGTVCNGSVDFCPTCGTKIER